MSGLAGWSIYGVRLADERYKQMQAVWEACEAASITIPQSVAEFFGAETPDGKEVLIDVEDAVSKIEIGSGRTHRFTIELDKIPEDIKTLRIEVTC